MIIKRLRKRVLELEKEIKNMKQGIQSPCKETDNIVEVSSGVCNECKRRQEPANLSINVIQNAQVPEDPTDIPVTDPTIDRDTRKRCVKIMHGFIGGKIKDPVASGIKNMDQFRICLQLLREMLMRSYAVGQRSKGRQVLQHPNSRSAESFAIRSKSTPNLQTAVTVGISKRDDRYQSPFEKKQENAIKKVRTRVQCRHSDQKIQKKNLLEFQTSIREQQLMLLHKELNGKVLKVKSQVARQRALLRNLKDNLGDAGEIEMEKTALKQLIKRGTRYENRLQVVNEQLKIIDQQYQHQKEAESCTVTSAASVELRNDKPSTQNQSSNPLIGSESDGRGSADLEATISSFKESVANKNSGKDGKVNTRKVLEILKKEEEKQAKIQSVLDEVRLESVNSHLALKEQVTRQKLEDFRKMLRQSKEAGNTSGGNTNSHDLHTASISSRKLVKASTYNCNTSEKDSQDSNTISMTSTPTIDVYVAPKVAKNQPKNAWNKRHEDHAVQRTDFHYNSTNSKSEIMAPKDSSAIVVSNDFSAGAKKSGIAQNFQISASTIHHQTSKTSFDTALDNMLQDSFVSGSDKATLTNSAGTSMVVAPTNHATSLNLINENNSMPTLSGDDLKATDYSTPDKTSEPEPHHSFVKKSDDFSKLQQKLSEYLGARQSSTPKTRPTMMSASHGSLQSSVDIPSFYNPSQDKLTSTSTSLTTLNSSDSKGLPFDRAYRQMFPSTASLPSYSNRAYENEVNEFSFKSNTTPKLPSDISLPLRKDSFPSSFLPEPSKLLAAPVEDNDREVSYVRAVKENKLRVKKIHEAREAAAVIQKAWKGYVKKK
ncbi:uncharacterized protein LOC117102882 isoform X2 [Anneissia japonica]|uniref:uncharacterized protein LOC117102882 isoform X2 n=1 Tax=Anneissia japonica TaxID=1529436 RepID=UPI001425849D|nr:uncharacterized protein LOC117102882 isoform X2 [Anneissia japonica]